MARCSPKPAARATPRTTQWWLRRGAIYLMYFQVLIERHALGFIDLAVLIQAPLDQLHGNGGVVGRRPRQQMIQALLLEILAQGVAQLPR